MAFTDPTITFGATGLQGESSTNPTAIDTSKTGDPVIYVAQQNGNIYRYEISRLPDSNGDGIDEFVVTSTTLINVIPQTTQNYNDDGTANGTNQRQMTGLVTTIDEDGNDVLYVNSSDWRIAVGTDSGLDTNSGHIHKIVIASEAYAAANDGVEVGDILSNVAIIRGLPRSEENHSTNGLDLSIDPVTGDTYLWIAQGGNTNKGAPGNNFSGTVDFALSGTIIKVNLTELESYDIRIDGNGEPYILDLPTLDDPTRPNVDLLDYGLTQQQIDDNPNFSLDDNGSGPDWAGGNNGLNQAKITDTVLVSVDGQLTFVDNPLAVHSPGARNQYDVLVTEAGEVFTWDNGPNTNWGGQPLSYEDGAIVNDWTQEFATNQFNESGSNGYGDQLHYLGNITDEYGPYMGDANPIRASKEALEAIFNPDGTFKNADPSAPIISADGETLFADRNDALNYVASILIIYDEQGDGNWVDITGTTGLPADLFDIVSGYDWFHPGSSLNDPTDYYDGTSVQDGTAYSPESQLFDDNNDGSLKTVNASTNGLAEYTGTAFGGDLQGVIIAASFNGNLYFEKPIDTDGDGRTDAVESLGTIGGFGSQPLTLTTLGDAGFSDAVLIDNDNDGVDDFAGLIFAATYGADNVTIFVPGADPIDPSDDLDLDGKNNTVDTHVGDDQDGLGALVGGNESLTWHFELNNPASTPAGAIPSGDSIAGDIGINAVWRNNVDVQFDLPGQPALYDDTVWNLGGASSFVSIDQADDGSAEGTANDQNDVLGIGFATKTFTGAVEIVTEMSNIFLLTSNIDDAKTWDGGEKAGLMVGSGDQTTFAQAAIAVIDDGGTIKYGIELVVEENDIPTRVFVEMPGIENPTVVGVGVPLMQVGFDIDLTPGLETVAAKARFVDDGVFTDWVSTSALSLPQDVVDAVKGQYNNGGAITGAVVGLVSTAAAGDDSFAADWDFVTINGTPLDLGEGQVLFRVNAGGPEILALDGGPDWAADTGAANNPNLVDPGSNGTTGFPAVEPNASVPPTTPGEIFDTERWDQVDGTEMQWEFDVPQTGLYEVRLYMGNGFDGTSAGGQRVFEVQIEGQTPANLSGIDLSGQYGHLNGVMISNIVTVTDGTIDIDFIHGVENPLINGIEILALSTSSDPVVSVADASASEGSGVLSVGVSAFPAPDVNDDITVNFQVTPVGGGATPGVDYSVPGAVFDDTTGVYTGSITIAGGSGDGTIPVTILPDTEFEGDELFQVEITGVVGANATVGDGIATVQILDDDAPTGGTVLYRVNNGGPVVNDTGLDWSADQATLDANAGGAAVAGTPSPYLDLTAPAADNTFGADFTGANTLGVPSALFETERWSDAPNPDNMSWDFSVANGDYIVNLYFAEIWDGAQTPGVRVFDVEIEGDLALDDFDITAAYGWNTAGVESIAVTVDDGNLDIDFLQGLQNPKISAIEIIAADGTYNPPADNLFGTSVEISDDRLAPTNAGLLSPGDNFVVATQEGEGDGANGVRDRDYFTFTVPDGYALTGIVLEDFVNGNPTFTDGFMGIQLGDQLTVDPLTGAPDTGTDGLLGGLIYGFGTIGQDLLDLMAAGGEVQPGFSLPGFTPELTGEVTVWLNQGAGPGTPTLNFIVEPLPGTGEVVAAINAGGPALTQDGIDFSADQFFTDGTVFADSATDGNGEQPIFDGTVYETERFGGAPTALAPSYNIPVAQGGEYTIELYFAEIYQTTPGQRVFDVIVEGVTVLDDFDILAQNGGDINAPIVFQVPGTFMPETFGDPTTLDIDFTASVDNAKISAIVVREAVDAGPTGGAATLTVNNNNDDIQISNFGNGSFVLTNTGTKDIVSFEIDVTNALYPDSVFDPFGLAGDLTSKAMTINGGSATGVMEPSGGYYVGAGGVLGFEGVQLEFDPNTDGGFNPGESVAFAVDMDPNSIAGAEKGTLDSGADPAGWDIGGISGAELIGSTFTITFADGSTATGQLQGQTDGSGVALQGGSQGLASQDVSDEEVDLTVNGLGAGGVGTYSDGGPSVIVNGPAGQTARIVLTMGFIQPGENNFPDTSDPNEYHDQLDAQLAALAAGDFPANNAVDFQTVDIVLTGNPQDISSLFDFSQVVNGGPVGGGGWNDDVEGQLPIGMVASLIDPSNGDLPIGPVTAPIYLQYAELQEADLSLDKTVSDATPGVGDTITFTLNLTNAGNLAATGVQVEDLLPAGYTFVSANASVGTYDDGTGLWDVGGVAVGATETLDITVTVEEVLAPDVITPVIRVNAGGDAVASINGGPDWGADTNAAPSSYRIVDGGGDNVYTATSGGAHAGPIDFTAFPDLAADVPVGVFEVERWDPIDAPSMKWAFPFDAGTEVQVTLYFAELFGGITAAGARSFDVSVEGNIPAEFNDIDPFGAAGAKGAYAVTTTATVDGDGELNLEFLHDLAENPALKGIEIATITSGGVDASAYENYAQVLASDQDDPDSTPGDGSTGDDDDATVSVTALNTADLELSKTVSDSAPAFGDTITFTLTVTNTDGIDATNVAVNDLLPNGFAYTGDDSGGAYDPVSGDWDVGTVGVGESATLTITATVNGDVTLDDTVLYRVNAGGAELAALEPGGLAWAADTGAANNPNLVEAGSNNVNGFAVTPGATVPVTTPASLFSSERWDNTGGNGQEMQWEFAVPQTGLYEVRLYMGNGFGGTSEPGTRVFDVQIEGVTPLNLDDLDLSGQFGHQVGGMVSNTVNVTDGVIDIDFIHGVENTLVNGIEIIQIGGEQPADYTNYAQIIAADQADPDSVAGDGSTSDDDDATVVVNATLLGANIATIAATVAGAGEGGPDGEFTVTLEDNVSVETTIAYLIEGSATNGDDYAALSGQVVIAAGTNSAVIPVNVIDDGEFDPDETVVVTLTDVLSGDANVVVGAADSDTVTIGDNDPPEVQGGSLSIAVTPGGGLGATVFGGSDKFQLTNTSDVGVQITSVSIDLSTGVLPDMVFDPIGAGGDDTAQVFTPGGTAGAVGLVVPTDPATDPFSQPRNGGFDVITLDFTDFDAGETFQFSTDVDPNSIQGVPGAGAAGAVSGYELMGATVTVTFSDGTYTETTVGTLFDEDFFDGGAGNVGGAAGEVTTEDAVAAPTLSVLGQTGDLVPSLPGTQVDVDGADFTLLVEGEAGATVNIVQMDSRLFIASGEPPFDVAPDELPFYANEAMAGKAVFSGVIGAGGTLEIPASLIATAGEAGTPNGGLNAFIAVVTNADGEISTASAPLVVKQGVPLVYDAPGLMSFDGTSGTGMVVPHSGDFAIPQGTIAYSFIANDTSGDQGHFSKDTSYFGEGGHTSIFLDGTSLVARLQTIDASIELNFSGVSSGEEYEVAVTFGPNGVELWVDGNLVDSDPTAISWENNPEDMHWGQRNWSSKGPDAPFNGVIADKQIYAQVLTASQIAALAANSSATNDQPVAVDDVAMLDEDSGPLVIDVAANDTDSDGGTPVANAIVAGPANGTADVNPDGTVSYDPDPDFNGVDTFTVEIADGQGGFDTSLVTVTVNPIEDDPVANDDLGSTQEGVAVDIDVLANDTDGDGDTLSVIAVGTAGNGTVLDNGDGTVTYTPNGGFTGTDMFTYEVSDGDGPTDTATVTVEVTPEPVDNPPVANDDAAATTQGVAVIIDLLGNDTDADGDPLEIDMIGVVANGEVVDNGNGTVTYTPDPDFVGTEIFTYVASDGDDLSNTATVTVDVTEEPDFPEPIFQLAGVNAYGGSSANVDNFAHETVFEQEAITLAFSFIADSFSRRDGLITKDASGNGAGGHFAALLNGDDLDIRIQDASDSYTLNLDNLNAGQEYEVAVVITNDVAQLWVDGALIEETTSIDATWDTNTEYLNIGANGWASDPGSSAVKDGFDGAIADVEIYAQQLSEDQIQELAALSSFDVV